MQLQLSTWQEVDEYLKESNGIIIPIGSTEQHGPNGMIGTDAICPEFIAKGVAEKVGTMVAPTLSIGMAQHHLGFSGSITLRPTTLIAVIRDVIQSLSHHGFERMYFLNGHGGNIATVNAAFSEVYTEISLGAAASNRQGLRLALRNWWSSTGVQRISDEQFGHAEGSHATASEISLTFYAYPDQIKSAPMSPRIAPQGPIRDAVDYRRRFPDGRIGSNPALASKEIGEQLYRAAVQDTAAHYRQFLRTD